MIITGAIFDLDGTLIDSMPVWKNLIYNYLIERNAIPEKDLAEKTVDMDLKTASEYIHENYLPDETPEKIEKDINDMVWHAYSETIPIKHGVKPFLFALRCKGVRMCVATASARPLVEAVLKRLNIEHYFSVILTCPELNTTKEDPLIYQKAYDILGTPMETTYVFEDSLYCVRTAKAAGFKVAAVKDEMSLDDSDEIKALADIYIKDFDDFRGMIG